MINFAFSCNRQIIARFSSFSKSFGKHSITFRVNGFDLLTKQLKRIKRPINLFLNSWLNVDMCFLKILSPPT